MNQRSTLCALLVVPLIAAPWACGTSSNNGSSSGGDGGSPDGNATASSSGSSNGTSSGSSNGSSSGASSSSGGSSGSSSGVDAGQDAGFDAGASVLLRGNDYFRRATYTEPTLTQAAVTTMAPDTTFNTNATFPAIGNTTGQGLPSVLYLESGPAAAGCPTGATSCTATTRAAGAGIFLAFGALGSNPNAFAFDETTGLPVWKVDVTNGTAGGGGDGIRGTPAIDPISRRVFIVTGNGPHVVHALSVDTGVEQKTGGWPVTLSMTSVKYGDAGFNSGVQNQRGALLLVNGTLYIPFGGEDGDGGNYLGWIVAIDTTTPSSIGAWATLSPKSGIWASGGPASDGINVYAETGNSNVIRSATVLPSAWDSEEVVALTGLAVATRDGAHQFLSHEWKPWDQGDLDLGASAPAVVPLGATSNPPSIVVAPGKAGVVYFLNGSNLSQGVWPGDAGGELQELTVAGGGQAIYTAPTVYGSASGIHVAINAGQGPFGGCPSATQNVAGTIISMLVNPAATPMASVAWCVDNEVGSGNMQFPPISTTTDGISANPIVWFLTGSSTSGAYQLMGVNGDNGDTLVTTSGTPCATVPSISFPIAVHGRIVVSAIGSLCSWSLGGH